MSQYVHIFFLVIVCSHVVFLPAIPDEKDVMNNLVSENNQLIEDSSFCLEEELLPCGEELPHYREKSSILGEEFHFYGVDPFHCKECIIGSRFQYMYFKMNNEKFIEKVYEVSNIDEFHCLMCSPKVLTATAHNTLNYLNSKNKLKKVSQISYLIDTNFDEKEETNEVQVQMAIPIEID